MANGTTIQELQGAVEKVSGALDKAYNEAWDLATLLSEQAGDVAKAMLHRDDCPDWDEWEALIASNAADVVIVALALFNYLDRDAEEFLGQALSRHQVRMSNKVSMNYHQIVLERLGYAHSKGFYLPEDMSSRLNQALQKNINDLSPSLRHRISE